MRYAQVPGYNPSFPVKYGNMYRDYSMTTPSFSDPFNSFNTATSAFLSENLFIIGDKSGVITTTI